MLAWCRDSSVAVVWWGVPGGGTARCQDPVGNELRAATKPCCAGNGDGAGGSVVVVLDPDAGLIDACTNTGAYVAANPADSSSLRLD